LNKIKNQRLIPESVAVSHLARSRKRNSHYPTIAVRVVNEVETTQVPAYETGSQLRRHFSFNLSALLS